MSLPDRGCLFWHVRSGCVRGVHGMFRSPRGQRADWITTKNLARELFEHDVKEGLELVFGETIPPPPRTDTSCGLC